jgi:hypothetical protein
VASILQPENQFSPKSVVFPFVLVVQKNEIRSFVVAHSAESALRFQTALHVCKKNLKPGQRFISFQFALTTHIALSQKSIMWGSRGNFLAIYCLLL